MRGRTVGVGSVAWAFITLACSGSVFTGGGGDAGIAGASATGGAQAQGGSGGGVACGPNVCGANQICCDASCGICGSINGACPAIACVPGTGGSSGTGGATSTSCDQNCTSSGFTCCSNACRNVDNDPTNCGACGVVCPSDKPICISGECQNLSCSAEQGPPGTQCCGTTWCAAGQLCCQAAGPVVLDKPQCLSTADGTCPRGCKLCVCANPTTPIETPSGTRAINDLEVGDLVYSVEHDAIVVAPIVETRRRPARGHVVPQIALSNGQILQISGPHPTAEGRTFDQLREGDVLGTLRVTSVEWVTYEQPYTYDILPATDTGYYFAAGALIGSTLKPNGVTHPFVRPAQQMSPKR